jgi:hypothetical protein
MEEKESALEKPTLTGHQNRRRLEKTPVRSLHLILALKTKLGFLSKDLVVNKGRQCRSAQSVVIFQLKTVATLINIFT